MLAIKSIIAQNSFVVLSRSGIKFYVDGALNGRMESDVPLEVVDAVTMLTMSDGSNIILQMNQSLLDSCPTQYESLLQPHQCRAHGVRIDDCPIQHRTIDGNNGTQSIRIMDKIIPLQFDGLKCYMKITKPSSHDISKYPRVKLTSHMPYNPRRIYTRRRNTAMAEDVNTWRANLGYPTFEVAKKTLECTICLYS